VRPGEGATLLLLALNVFFLLTAYYLIKPVRESLILAQSGAEVKSYASAGQVLLLAVVVPVYSRLAGRFDRRRLITVVSSFFIACLVVFYALVLAGARVGVVFYLWVGIFNLMVVAQFWSFANDVYTPEEGKRLFAVVAFGASLGAVLGSKIAAALIPVVGVAQLLLVSAGLLVVCIALTAAVDAREHGRRSAAPQRGGDPGTGAAGKTNGFTLLLRNRYLLLIAFLMLFANWVNTTGEYILGRLVGETAARLVEAGQSDGLDKGAWIGRFYSNFFFGVNLVGVIVQLFLVSRILKYLGVRVALLVLPVISLLGNGLIFAYPLLRFVRWSKTAENATDYSLQNTVRNVLFLPLTREEKYNAKQAIDTFFVRVGDVLSAGLVFAGTHWVLLGVRGFAAVNLGLGVVWILLALRIGAEYRKQTEAGVPGA